MKKNYFLLLLIIAFVLAACVKTEKQQIRSIDKIKEKTQHELAIFTRVQKLKDSNCCRYVYLKDKELKLITAYYKGTETDKNEVWYFSKGDLIYFEKFWTDNQGGSVVYNEKFYIADGHLIAWFKYDSKPVDKSSTEFKDFDSNLSSYIEKLKEDNK